MVILRVLSLALFGLFAAASASLHAEGTAPLRVALSGNPPFVISSGNGVYTGLAIDVWDAVTTENSWSFTYTFYANQGDAVHAVAEGKADIAVGNISILSSLFSTVEFSQPFCPSGLQIMIVDARPHTLAKLWEELSSWLRSEIFWGIVVVILIATVLFTLFERKHNPDFPKTWRDGLAESFYNVVSLSLGKSSYKGFAGWKGRLVMTFWTVLGVLVVVFATSNITSRMTVENLHNDIKGPDDLPGHTVGAVAGTAAIVYLQANNIPYLVYPDLPTAVQALVAGKIPAIVDAAPILQYYDNSHQDIPITEVGKLFSAYNYGFAMPVASPLRGPLNAALVTLRQNNVLYQLGFKYFGEVFAP